MVGVLKAHGFRITTKVKENIMKPQAMCELNRADKTIPRKERHARIGASPLPFIVAMDAMTEGQATALMNAPVCR
ncbi:unnamed protein product [Strongylus vulgaris]|uniref:Uncharacterized protein n=1 Tax=Strongylus vulgaris TaxID=40348 RepID=A0A3P7IDM6_STRVU|nr:unnamed protein product [Strongylus vulgaris]